MLHEISTKSATKRLHKMATRNLQQNGCTQMSALGQTRMVVSILLLWWYSASVMMDLNLQPKCGTKSSPKGGTYNDGLGWEFHTCSYQNHHTNVLHECWLLVKHSFCSSHIVYYGQLCVIGSISVPTRDKFCSIQYPTTQGCSIFVTSSSSYSSKSTNVNLSLTTANWSQASITVFPLDLNFWLNSPVAA